MIEKKLKLGNLFDFYGPLLTLKQQDVINQYCFHDLSLGEISENLTVSRQAINDTIQKCEKIMDSYESKLNMHEKYKKRKKNVSEINLYLDSNINELLDMQLIDNIKKKLSECIE